MSQRPTGRAPCLVEDHCNIVNFNVCEIPSDIRNYSGSEKSQMHCFVPVLLLRTVQRRLHAMSSLS